MPRLLSIGYMIIAGNSDEGSAIVKVSPSPRFETKNPTCSAYLPVIFTELQPVGLLIEIIDFEGRSLLDQSHF